MAGWNGSGVFTKTHSWVADALNGIKILASRHDQNDTDFTNGINNCLTKDGQNAATANLPMGTFKHTNIGDATARNQYLSMGQYQDQDGKYYVTTGTANAYVITASPAITAYSSGQSFSVNFHAGNTGTATVNINSVGTATIVKDGAVALASGNIITDAIYNIVYDGTNFQVIDYYIPAGSGLNGLSSATMVAEDSLIFIDATDNSTKKDLVTTILKIVYPVGSYYINETVATDPATLLGFGTWSAVTDKFIVGHGATYTSTGGAATVTLTTTELPPHTHVQTSPNGSGGTNNFPSVDPGNDNSGSNTTQSVTSSTGSGAAFSIIPPYQAAYIWKRTA